MLLLLAVIVTALAAGLATGGRAEGLGRLDLRWWGLAPTGLALQLLPTPHTQAGDGTSVALLLLSYVLLLAFTLVNRRRAGFALIGIGLALNLLVIGVNGGMPVTRSALERSGQARALLVLETGGGAKHHLADGDLLMPLADVIPIGGPFNQVVSAGDLVMYAGIAWFIVSSMRRPKDEIDEGTAQEA